MTNTLITLIDWTFIAISVASLGAWIWMLSRYFQSGIQPVQPRSRPEPIWTLAEFFLMFGLWMVCTAAAAVTAQRYWGPADDSTSMSAELEKAGSMPQSVESLTAVSVAIAIANIVVVICMMVHMGLTDKHSLSRSGLLPKWDDVRLGLLGSFLILPPVLWLATLLQNFVEYEHKVFDLIESNPVPSVFWAMALSVVAVTPIVEEFMFRMLLQGGCDRVVRRSPGASGRESLAQDDLTAPDQISANEIAGWSWWPVVISSLAFSMLHLGQGAAPIALFFFALAVGYLYRQTGRLWPCIIVHLVLNGISLSGFILQVISKGEAS